MKNKTLGLMALLVSVAAFSGCAAISAESPPSAGTGPKEPKVRVEAKLLTYKELREIAEKNSALNERLLKLAPAMAYKPGVAHADIIPFLPDVAAFAAKEIVNWLGNRLEEEAKKHSAQFAAFVEQPDWWAGAQPIIAAVELTRTTGKGSDEDRLFDAIVIIRPVMSTVMPEHPRIAAFQLLPVYLLEKKAAAEDFTDKMGAVLTVHIEASWTNTHGDPVDMVLVDYADKDIEYQIGKPFLFDEGGQKGPQSTDDSDADKPPAASHFFAMPEHPATISVNFCFAETDPSKWVGVLEELGKAIGGQADNASSAVKKKLGGS